MKRYLSIAFCLTLLLFAGCSKDGMPDLETPIAEGKNIYGLVTDENGNYMPGVTVSDGYSCAVTDENGVYQLASCEFSYHVFVSVPADCKIPMSDGLPCFWKKLVPGTERYDFTLERMPQAEGAFNLLCIADPQCQSTTNVNRFTSETVPDIYETVSSSDLPCYGVVLGDIGWNTANNDYTNAVFPLMRVAMKQDKVGLPLFMAMGNHDNKVIKASYSVAHDIKAQRNFEYLFGPVNYSFDRSKTHIIVMDDIIYSDQDKYSLGFRDDQVEWLKQDLANVPKDRLIILCVHIPVRANTGNNVKEVVEMLEEYAGLYIMSGHTHYAEINDYGSRYEHVHGAACGAWWHSTVNIDGTPNGYGVYRVDGAEITSKYYKATGHDKGFQIRLYRGADEFMKGYTPSYRFYYSSDKHIVANIWNADASWTVSVYENGVKTGTMKKFESAAKKCDAWASGYHRGVQGRADNYENKNNSHLYFYELQDAGAKVRVEAVDPLSGETYTQESFTGNTAEYFPVGE